MSDFGTAVDIVCAVIAAVSIFLLFFGEKIAARFSRREDS